jgi:hypothetical protein
MSKCKDLIESFLWLSFFLIVSVCWIYNIYWCILHYPIFAYAALMTITVLVTKK